MIKHLVVFKHFVVLDESGSSCCLNVVFVNSFIMLCFWFVYVLVGCVTWWRVSMLLSALFICLSGCCVHMLFLCRPSFVFVVFVFLGVFAVCVCFVLGK